MPSSSVSRPALLFMMLFLVTCAPSNDLVAQNKVPALPDPKMAPATETSTQNATDIMGKDKITLLTSARSRYYNLRAAGVKSYHCDVDIEWNQLFIAVAGAPLPDDDPLLVSLRSARLRFSDSLDAASSVTWTLSGAAPEGKEKQTDQLRASYKQMVEGFLTAWSPSQNGQFISLSPRYLRRTATGYVFDDAEGSNRDAVSLDKDLLITHLSTLNSNERAEGDLMFTPSPSGLLLSAMEMEYSQPPAAPPTHIKMSTTYALVDTYELPEKLTVTIPNVATFKMGFSSCAVVKQP